MPPFSFWRDGERCGLSRHGHGDKVLARSRGAMPRDFFQKIETEGRPVADATCPLR